MTDPLDPLTPDDDLLAVSALLDGTATPEDEARVAADDALGELLATLRDQRGALADVAVGFRGREDALAAALTAFDELHARDLAATTGDDVDAQPFPENGPERGPERAAPLTNVIRFERRRTSYRLLTGVAAAVGILFVGALVAGGLGSMGGDDEESSSVATEAAAKTAAPAEAFADDDPATPMVESAEAMSADVAAGSTAFDSRSSTAMETEGASEATEAPAATQAPAATEDSIDSIDGGAEVQVTINTPQQLLDYANTQQAVLPLPGLGLPCVTEGFQAIGQVTYQGTPSVVVRDPSTGSVSVLDLTGTCAVVVTVDP